SSLPSARSRRLPQISPRDKHDAFTPLREGRGHEESASVARRLGGMQTTSVLTVATLTALLLLAADAPAGRVKLHGNNFYANCRFSHTNDDDPIVYPGQPGRSHPHTFFGNASTDASSTLSSLRKARTTCKPSADKAAYWVPTLFRGSTEVGPQKGQFY